MPRFIASCVLATLGCVATVFLLARLVGTTPPTSAGEGASAEPGRSAQRGGTGAPPAGSANAAQRAGLAAPSPPKPQIAGGAAWPEMPVTS